MRTFNVTMVSPRGSWIKLAQKADAYNRYQNFKPNIENVYAFYSLDFFMVYVFDTDNFLFFIFDHYICSYLTK